MELLSLRARADDMSRNSALGLSERVQVGAVEMADTRQGKGPNTALLMIDFQRDFLADDGRMPVARYQTAAVIEAAQAAMLKAKTAGQLVLAIGNEFRRSDWLMNILRRHAAIAGSSGTQWDNRLPLDGVIYLPKWAGSAFSNPRLVEILDQHKAGTLELTGLFARACVSATAKDAMKKGFQVRILGDAIACASDRSRAAALTRLRSAGAAVSTASSIP